MLRILSLVLLASSSFSTSAAGRVEVVTDFLAAFDTARVTNALECAVRRPATAGGVQQPALFEHPLAPDQPARVEYPVTLPPASGGELLLLTFDTALSDGIQRGKGEDGVRFVLEVDGRTLFSREETGVGWHHGVLDLTPFAGRSVQLTLVTEAIRNTAYDWALWGKPRLLRVTGATPALAGAELPPVGLLLVRGGPAAKALIRLQSTAGTDRLEWQLSPEPGMTPTNLATLDYAYPGPARIDWEPPDALERSQVQVAAYAPRLRLTSLGPDRGVVVVHERTLLATEVSNEGPGFSAGEETITLTLNHTKVLDREPVQNLGAGRQQRIALEQVFNRPGQCTLEAELRTAGGARIDRRQCQFQVYSDQLRATIASPYLRLRFYGDQGQPGYGVIEPLGLTSTPLASARFPLLRVVLESRDGPRLWEVPWRTATPRAGSATTQTFEVAHLPDPDGVTWDLRLRFSLETNRPLVRLAYSWKPLHSRAVRQLMGPDLYVGDQARRPAKSGGLFPGLEYLFGAEPSSNPRDLAPPLHDRRSPHPDKVTIPLMAVSVGDDSPFPNPTADRFYTPDSLQDGGVGAVSHGRTADGLWTIGLFWDPLQKWDGQHAFPSPRYASPNTVQGGANHRLGLFLPSVPDLVRENAEFSTVPYVIEGEKEITLQATISLTRGASLGALRQWLLDRGGLPEPGPAPRSFQRELDICREGLLKTVWDPTTERWRHCIGWEAQPAPGLAALAWLDAQTAEDPAQRRRSAHHFEQAVSRMLRESGPGVLTSQACCHVMQWELPFLYGYLPEALAPVHTQIGGIISRQQAFGGWTYQPANQEQASLGRAQDSVLGTSATMAAALLRYARITGDTTARDAGLKALQFMERFRVPRGGQTWECPMYEPDILAAAYAVRAYHDGFRVTQDARWLQDAVYWAETGVPFVYLWTRPGKPMMLGATIPVFGSTFYTHSWLAVPVQWCGLVYAYHVRHLADELDRHPVTGRAVTPLTPQLDFSPADWRRLADLITVSGMNQQFDSGDKIGTYPDSVTRFEQRNPAFLNPEDILVNVLAQHGVDPDVKTLSLDWHGARIVVSSEAIMNPARAETGTLAWEARFFPNQRSHTLVTGLRPRQVRVGDEPLPEFAAPAPSAPGWCWDPERHRACLVIAHPSSQPVRLTIEPASP